MGLAKNNAEIKQHAKLQFEQILKRATEKKASDIHLKVGVPPIVRVNGQLYYLSEEGGTPFGRLNQQELSDIGYALMNERQSEKYENGLEVDLGYEIPGCGRYRINLCQQRSNPRLVCRFIPEAIKTIAQLGLPSSIEQLASSPRGLILVTGATGSGKSTTLAAMIDHIARNRSCHIITIEDPIEFSFRDRKSIVTQREVGLDTPNFVQALKYSLRQDPDVILVGEMRDEETISMALTAAETGHLVLSTLHTLDATETINRILASISPAMQMQIRLLLAAVLVGVVSQRLVRRKDTHGRVAAVEVLVSNARVKEMISEAGRTHDLRRVIEQGQSQGMLSFDQCLMILYQKGLINKEEALLNSTNPQDFQLRLEGVVPGEWREDEDRSVSHAEKVKEIMKSEGIVREIELDRTQLEPKKK
ncbi:MAG: PilT/PilU family type 4a pilus ATPase [Deltaproteobacteria bacterium]|nr:PilT/PilU family type 4a pilus ATPase [Deltaproteobacteria bacterium]